MKAIVKRLWSVILMISIGSTSFAQDNQEVYKQIISHLDNTFDLYSQLISISPNRSQKSLNEDRVVYQINTTTVSDNFYVFSNIISEELNLDQLSFDKEILKFQSMEEDIVSLSQKSNESAKYQVSFSRVFKGYVVAIINPINRDKPVGGNPEILLLYFVDGDCVSFKSSNLRMN